MMEERELRRGPRRPGGDRIGTGRFESFLRRLLSVKGVIAPDVSGIVATLNVDDLVPEHLYLRGSRLAAGGATAGAVAAQFGQVSISPPVLAPQQSIYTVERVIIQCQALATVRLNVGPALSGAVVAGERFTRDERWGVGSQPTMQLLAGTAAAVELTSNFLQLVALGGYTPTVVDMDAVVTGNLFTQSVNVECQAANIELVVAAFWRERPFESSER